MNQKELLKGTLDAIILKLLTDNDRMYGYQMVQQVKAMSGKRILVKEGSLYPALHKLEADGLVVTEQVAVGGRTRKYYRLTPSGKTTAKTSVDELLLFLQTIHHLITAKPLAAHGTY